MMKFKSVPLNICVLGLMYNAMAYAEVLDKTTLKVSGYIKLDALVSQYENGTLSAGNVGRDFYVPSLTPVGDGKKSTMLDSHIRQSRFRLSTETTLSETDKLGAVVEFDFQTTPNGDERISNSYSPRIRHVYLQYNQWLMGQTWTTFMDVAALPESVDFIGTTDGNVFVRQTMVRYSVNGLDVALENPTTTLTPYQSSGRIVSDSSVLPDVVARYTLKQDWGHVSVAAMMRQLRYDTVLAEQNVDSSAMAAGVNIASKIKVGAADDIRLSINYGSGLGRYLGLNTINDAVLDSDNELHTIDTVGLSLAYRHQWNELWYSNLMYSRLQADNDLALSGSAVNKSSRSIRLNVMYSPFSQLSFGLEFALAKLSKENELSGDLQRMQFMAKYGF